MLDFSDSLHAIGFSLTNEIPVDDSEAVIGASTIGDKDSSWQVPAVLFNEEI
jgi:hypothetical protein